LHRDAELAEGEGEAVDWDRCPQGLQEPGELGVEDLAAQAGFYFWYCGIVCQWMLS